MWRLFANGLAMALGCIPYLLFLAMGGDPASPAAWSQIGFLCAYPFWYRALWLMRQPAWRSRAPSAPRASRSSSPCCRCSS